MKAAYINQPCPAQNILYGDLPDPKPTPTECLVRIKAVAVNPIDTYVRSGTVKMNLPQPFIIGADMAGVVETVGEEVTRFKPGDRVWASNQGLLGRQGVFADFAAVDECWLYPTPRDVSDENAAAVALTGITAHLGVFHRANLKPGEAIFVSGGAGGVGSCVIQMAHATGARIFTTAGSDEKVALCRKLGATVAVNYKTVDIDAELKNFGPVDVWFETLRQQNFDRMVAGMARGGRMIVMAGRDARPEFPVGPFYVKDLSLFGFAMFNASADEQRKCAAEINRWMEKGKLTPVIGRTMPLSEAAAAHQLQEDNTLHGAGTLTGKIVLKVE